MHEPRAAVSAELRRPTTQAFREIGAFSALGLMILFTCVTFASAPLEGPFEFVERMATLGTNLMNFLDVGLGSTLTLLVTAFALLVGGQLKGQASDDFRDRRSLALMAELLASSLAAPTVLIVAACISNPAQAAVLFFLLPTTFSVVFIGAQIGAFLTRTATERLEVARRARERALDQVRLLRRGRSRQRASAVIAINAALTGLLSWIACASLASTYSTWQAPVAAFASTSLTIAIATCHPVFSAGARWAESTFERWAHRAGFVAFFVFGSASLAGAATFPNVGYLVGVLLGGCAALASCAWPARWTPRRLRLWTLRAASMRTDARNALRRAKSAGRDIRDLTAIATQSDEDVATRLQHLGFEVCTAMPK